MTLRDDLIKAKALVATPLRWRKSGLIGNGRRCALVACYDAEPGKRGADMQRALYLALLTTLRTAKRGFEEVTCVGRYNDDPATTHADIMALFDRAIAVAGAP